jgi:hypothetical protein
MPYNVGGCGGHIACSRYRSLTRSAERGGGHEGQTAYDRRIDHHGRSAAHRRAICGRRARRRRHAGRRSRERQASLHGRRLLRMSRPRRPGWLLQLCDAGAGPDRAAGRFLHLVPARGAERHAVILGRGALRQGRSRYPRLPALPAGTTAGQGDPAARRSTAGAPAPYRRRYR